MSSFTGIDDNKTTMYNKLHLLIIHYRLVYIFLLLYILDFNSKSSSDSSHLVHESPGKKWFSPNKILANAISKIDGTGIVLEVYCFKLFSVLW